MSTGGPTSQPPSTLSEREQDDLIPGTAVSSSILGPTSNRTIEASPATTSEEAGSTTTQKRPAPKLIAVFGQTGTGKTSFIELATGQFLGVGDHLPSFTEDVIEVRCQIGGQDVVLVDMPGFNDTYHSDIEILTRIATWMTDTYKDGALLSGIIYLHRITDNRMDCSENLNLRMFNKLYGRNNLKNVILGTTMWELVPDTDGIRRENDLKTEFWKDMIDKGSTVERIYKRPKWAKNLVRKLLNNEPMVTRFQEQIIAGKALAETDAGAELAKELSVMEETLVKKFENAHMETQQALKHDDIEAQNDLKREIAVLNNQLTKLKADQVRLVEWKPPPILPRVKGGGFFEVKWMCAFCGSRTHQIGTWKCPGCKNSQRNIW